MDDPIQSACFSPDGTVLVLGNLSGKWMTMDCESREIYALHYDGNEPIQVMYWFLLLRSFIHCCFTLMHPRL